MKEDMLQLPPIKLDYLESITDETGIVQHTKFATPNRREGYATDDNARALIVCTRHNGLNRSPESAKLAGVYLSFLYHMQMEDGKLHNFLSYDRRFLDDVGSDDSLGRVLWACGCVINSNLDEEKKLLDEFCHPPRKGLILRISTLILAETQDCEGFSPGRGRVESMWQSFVEYLFGKQLFFFIKIRVDNGSTCPKRTAKAVVRAHIVEKSTIITQEIV